MTLEPEPDDAPKEKIYHSGKKRKTRAIRRAHKREKEGLEERVSEGLGLTSKETARLGVLRDVYD